MSEALDVDPALERPASERPGPGGVERDAERGAGDLRPLSPGPALGDGLELRLRVTDPELLEALSERSPGLERDRFAATALRIGVLALRSAAGRIDAERVRDEGERLLGELGSRLSEHQRSVNAQVQETLRGYFDPDSGRFHERVERLVRRDGELEELLRRHMGEGDSALARTLASHVGEGSPLLELLSPEASDGLVDALERRVSDSLESQRERILREFSLDNKEGALSRLVIELSDNHGAFGRQLGERIDEVVAEFSLDSEDSALSRLVSRVEGAQERIHREFSLDHEGTALARMRRDLLEVLDEQQRGALRFQQEIREAVVALRSRREEAERSTRHGDDFEAEVMAFVRSESQRLGDVASHVGNSTGVIRHCKKGDAIVDLGSESAAPGARIVVEAKGDRSYDLGRALEECSEARRNREAEVGLFVFARRAAPEGLESIGRYGSDVVVVWDPEDPGSDVFLRVGLSVARALATRTGCDAVEREADLAAIDDAVREIERQAGGLADIRKAAETSRGAAGRIDDRARIMQDGLRTQLTRLTERLAELRAELGAG